MAHATDIVGYAYEADLHCPECTEKRFGADRLALAEAEPDHEIEDREGNPVSPVFNGGDAYEQCPGGVSGSQRCVEGTCRCSSCDNEHDCRICDGTGQVSRHCGDCGGELIR